MSHLSGLRTSRGSAWPVAGAGSVAKAEAWPDAAQVKVGPEAAL